MSSNEANILSTRNFDEIYGCLNGKGRSCIEGREITPDKIVCAISKCDLDKKTKQELVRQLSADLNLEQEYNLRENLIDWIYERFGIKIDFEKIIFEFAKGTRVKIRRDSEFAHQNGGIGILQNSFENGERVKVIFSNGYSDNYRKSDLELVDDFDQKLLKNVLSGISNKKREDFLNEVCDVIVEKCCNDELLLINLGLLNVEGLEVGDEIIMTESANGKYSFTKGGSIGKIIQIQGNGKFIVKFSLMTGNDGWHNRTWNVEKSYLRLLKPVNVYSQRGNKMDIDLSEVKKIVFKLIHDKVGELIYKLNNSDSFFRAKSVEYLVRQKFLLQLPNGNFVLNRNNIVDFVAPILADLYNNRKIFCSPDMFSPPAEKQPNALRLELTQGCDYNKCTYCGGYKGIPYKEKTFEEFEDHVDKVAELLGDYKDEIERLFIGGGNVLAVDQQLLMQSVKYVNRKFDPRRISIYGRTGSISKKGVEGLSDLKDEGLNLIYWGIETGSDAILKYVNKGTTFKQMIEAGKIANKANIGLSVMIMPGLGGIKYFDDHIKRSVILLNEIDSEFITFMTINAALTSSYHINMEKEVLEGINRPLTAVEIVQQVKEIISELRNKGQKVGMFGEEIDAVGCNPITFKGALMGSGKVNIVDKCDDYFSMNS